MILKKYARVIVIALSLCSGRVWAQVGIGTNKPDKSAVLDIQAEGSKGLLIPRVSLNSTTDVTGIAGGVPAQSLLVYNTKAGITGTGAAGMGYYYWDTNIWKKIALMGDIPPGDNLGNHQATLDLDMNNNNVNGAVNITASGNLVTQTMAIGTGSDNLTPQAGYIAYAADASGNVKWGPMAAIPSAVSGLWEFMGTNMITVLSGNPAATDIPMDGNTITLAKDAYVLITYSALPVGVLSAYTPPNIGSTVAQGTINLMIDGVKSTSSYFSNICVGTPGVGWGRIGNYVTVQKMVFLTAGTHTVGLKARVWSGGYNGGTAAISVNFNRLMTTYVGAVADDIYAGLSRISIMVFNQ